jgi:hypothetical protein
MSKILKCASNDDVITIRADDDADAVTFIFESPSKFFFFSNSEITLSQYVLLVLILNNA